MEQTLSVLLIEDDANDCNSIAQCMKKSKYLKLVATTGNARHALNMVQTHQPNVILLDIELHNGGGNGLQFLEKLKHIKLEILPYILITTQNNSRATHACARELGADIILAKYEEGYSAQYVIDYLELMRTFILRKNNLQFLHDTLTPEEKHQAIIKHIKYELGLIGIKTNSLGYNYLADAIWIIIDEPMTNIPQFLAPKYGKSRASIERAMQNAIKSTWTKNNIDDLLKHYTARINPDRGYPTTMELVYYYADKIKSEFETD